MPAKFLYNLTKKSVGASSAQALCGVVYNYLQSILYRKLYSISKSKSTVRSVLFVLLMKHIVHNSAILPIIIKAPISINSRRYKLMMGAFYNYFVQIRLLSSVYS